jgi:hypothetical protein
MVVGSRLSTEALSALAGAVCGAGLAIPISLVVLTMNRRGDLAWARPAVNASGPERAYPPVAAVSPPVGQESASGWHALPASMARPAGRHFTVVGASPLDTDVVVDEMAY